MIMVRLTLAKGVRLHPSVDILGAIVLTVLWLLAGHSTFSFLNKTYKSPNDLFVGLSALSGLVMAVATFICTTVYQSNARLMRECRKRFSDELARNWLSIISWTLVTAFLPLISLPIWEMNSVFSFGVVIFSTTILLEKSIRCIYWLNVTFLMESVSSKNVSVLHD